MGNGNFHQCPVCGETAPCFYSEPNLERVQIPQLPTFAGPLGKRVTKVEFGNFGWGMKRCPVKGCGEPINESVGKRV